MAWSQVDGDGALEAMVSDEYVVIVNETACTLRFTIKDRQTSRIQEIELTSGASRTVRM
jgi:hypothetical protein